MRLVGRRRLELPTSRLSGVRSNQLSYRPPYQHIYNLIATVKAFNKSDPRGGYKQMGRETKTAFGRYMILA